MKSYLDEIKRRRRLDGSGEIECLRERKRGRPLLLGGVIDSKVEAYVKKVREGGGTISARVVMAAARGILLSCEKHKLQEFGGHVNLTVHWAQSFLSRMNFVQRKGTTAKSKLSSTEFKEKKSTFLNDVYTIAQMEEIPAQLIMNWDQTGIRLVPSSNWTMEKRGARRIEIAGSKDKRQITAILCGTVQGELLPMQVIYKGRTKRCQPKFSFPLDWHITQSPKHWSNEETMLQYINHIIIPFVEKVRDRDGLDEKQAALVILDNFKGQITNAVLSLLDENNIHTCMLPANTTDILQPMDLSVNKPAKEFIKQKFQMWYAEQIHQQLQQSDSDGELEPVDLSMQIVKEVGSKWLVEMWEYLSNNPHLIVNGFVRSGICDALDGGDGNADEVQNLAHESSEESSTDESSDSA